MTVKYKLKRQEGFDAFATVGVSTAIGLKALSQISRSAAQAVFRGDPVTHTTALRVVSAVNKNGGDALLSAIFREVDQ